LDLILWRHADAADGEDPIDDLDRPLSSKGERQAERMGAWLARHLPSSTHVLVSPARRSRQTAEALVRKFRTVPGLAPASTVDSVLASVRWPDRRSPVLAVGHQPALGVTASYLLSGHPIAWTLRKGGVVWLRHRPREEGAQVLLVAALSPEMV
jgi:phosphohistidine phosphatase